MVGRGRPAKSEVRQRICDILFKIEEGYGYEIHKIYCDNFERTSRELIYYHLRKGVDTGEFQVKEVKEEKGDFSWGQVTKKIIYKIGPNGKFSGNEILKTDKKSK
ncbi:MAG: hypothetical protein ACQER9_03390 [Nanobdellota archaeon]